MWFGVFQLGRVQGVVYLGFSEFMLSDPAHHPRPLPVRV